MLLLACPDCSRQYDVTGLEPGSQVRCFCDALFLVAWPKQLSAGALTCTNCGGAVSVDDEACPYCRAGISEEDRRRTTLCPGCYTRLDDDSKHCRACGLAIAPQRLHPLPPDRGCPRCEGALRVRSLDAVDVTECGDCLGMWLTPELFDNATTEAARRNTTGSVFGLRFDPDAAPRTVEEVRYLPCLVCGELMNRRQYRYSDRPSGTIVDHCRHHGIWLDHEELERIVGFIEKAAEGGSAAMGGFGSGSQGGATSPSSSVAPISDWGVSRRRRYSGSAAQWLIEAAVDAVSALLR